MILIAEMLIGLFASLAHPFLSIQKTTEQWQSMETSTCVRGSLDGVVVLPHFIQQTHTFSLYSAFSVLKHTLVCVCGSLAVHHSLSQNCRISLLLRNNQASSSTHAHTHAHNACAGLSGRQQQCSADSMKDSRRKKKKSHCRSNFMRSNFTCDTPSRLLQQRAVCQPA